MRRDVQHFDAAAMGRSVFGVSCPASYVAPPLLPPVSIATSPAARRNVGAGVWHDGHRWGVDHVFEHSGGALQFAVELGDLVVDEDDDRVITGECERVAVEGNRGAGGEE
jgi:hypothetical protein